jgi:hypothetical protein
LLKAAVDVDRVVTFIDSLRLDVTAEPAIDMLAIVPPVSFKPVMSREEPRTRAGADRVLSKACSVVSRWAEPGRNLTKKDGVAT